MKKFKKFTLKSFMVMAVAASVFALVSCTDDDNGGNGSGGLSANDPEETVIVNLRNDGSNWIPCFDGYMACSDPSYLIQVGFSNYLNNFVTEKFLKFACVGKIAGLSSITARDTNSGYSETCAIIPGYGYIVKCSYLWDGNHFNTGYIRIYVDSWIKNTTNEIIGAFIKYQDNWIIRE